MEQMPQLGEKSDWFVLLLCYDALHIRSDLRAVSQ